MQTLFQVCARNILLEITPPFDLILMLFLFLSQFQIYVISLAEPRLPLQLEDAVRPEVEGEEVKLCILR